MRYLIAEIFQSPLAWERPYEDAHLRIIHDPVLRVAVLRSVVEGADREAADHEIPE